MNQHYLTLLVLSMIAITATAQIPDGYYSSLKGKSGSALKTAIHEIIKKADVLDYGSGSGKTWEGFYSTDRLEDNSVVDRYSNDTRYFTSKGSAIDGMNIEHSFPKSWWGGAKNQAYKDLYNLMPCESGINSKKSNYPMGEVTNDKQGNGYTKIGTGSNGYTLWEPADKWKGDFARGYMYMATAYQDFTWSGSSADEILTTGDYPTLQKWAYTLYIKWAKADLVDELEANRNEAVYKIQGNRNPYVDFPNLMEYVWGDSVNYAFDPDNTVRSTDYKGGGTVIGDDETIIYSSDFTASAGDCTIDNIDTPTTFDVWQQTSNYGWKASAYYNKTKYAADSRLVTPEIDLASCKNPILKFSHAVNFCASPADVLAVEIICDGEVEVLDGFTWGTGTSWTFKESGDIALDKYAGRTIQVGFHYTSTSSEASTWEIKNMEIRATRTATDIHCVEAVRLDSTQPYAIFSIDGRQMTTLPERGIVIVKQNGHTWKISR